MNWPRHGRHIWLRIRHAEVDIIVVYVDMWLLIRMRWVWLWIGREIDLVARILVLPLGKLLRAFLHALQSGIDSWVAAIVALKLGGDSRWFGIRLSDQLSLWRLERSWTGWQKWRGRRRQHNAPAARSADVSESHRLLVVHVGGLAICFAWSLIVVSVQLVVAREKNKQIELNSHYYIYFHSKTTNTKYCFVNA